MVLLLIFFIPQLIINQNFYNNLKSNHSEKIKELTNRSQKQVDSRFTEIDNIMSQIILDPEFRYSALSYSTDSKKLYNYALSLPRYQYINSVLEDIIIYFYQNELFIKPGVFSLRPETFFKANINDNYVNYKPWVEDIKSNIGVDRFFRSSFKNLGFDTTTADLITYIKDFPIGNKNSTKGIIMSSISLKSLFSTFDKTQFGEKGDFIILYNDEFLASLNFVDNYNHLNLKELQHSSTVEIGIETFQVITIKSRFKGITYVSLIPDTLLLHQINNFLNISITVFIIFLLIGISISIFFALQSTKPINKLFNLIDSKEKNNKQDSRFNSFEDIFTSVEKIVDKNDLLQVNIKKNRDNLKSGFLSQLIFGNFKDQETLNSYLNYIELPLLSKNYILTIGKLTGFNIDNKDREVIEELEQKKLLIKTVIEEEFNDSVLIQNLQSDKVIILFHSNKGFDKNIIKSFLNRISQKLEDHLKIKSQFALGNVYNKIIDTAFSYKRVITIFNNPVPAGDRVICVDNSNFTEKIWTYSLETELQLISLVRMGEFTKSIGLFNQLKEDNENLSRSRKLDFLYELSGTVYKLAYQLLDEDNIASFEIQMNKNRHSEHIMDYYTGIEEQIKQLCSISEKNKESHNTQLRDSVLKYVNDHYADFDINLYKVASHFNLAEKYLSRFFKDQGGHNFASYIEDLRMNHAVMLMSDTKYSLTEISKKVGYCSHNTFYKAFKRKFSVSPGVYREKMSDK